MTAAAQMLSAPAFAQWLNYPTPGIPRSPTASRTAPAHTVRQSEVQEAMSEQEEARRSWQKLQNTDVGRGVL